LASMSSGLRFCFALLALVAFSPAWSVQHVFLTYSGAPETTIDINIVEARKSDSIKVRLSALDGTPPASIVTLVRATYVPTAMELADGRALHVATITGLVPGTIYRFDVVGGEGDSSPPRMFRTLPGGMHPFRFVNGGDMGVSGDVGQLMAEAGRRNPDFAVIGGDITYDNGFLRAAGKWDKWLQLWSKHMVAPDGRMIPIIAIVGNHEVSAYQTDDASLRAPWYTSLFGRQGQAINHSRRFGDLLALISLDTGHLSSHASQASWLESALREHASARYRIANYHVPLYPAHRDFNGRASAEGREHWLPLFDRFGLTAALEHHDHVLKRTKPLRHNRVEPGGTVYIGDGAFGRPPRKLPTARWYNEIALERTHFWQIDVSPEMLKFTAVAADGVELDGFELR